MEARVENNQLVLIPVKKAYSLEALLAECDVSAPDIGEQDIGDKTGPVGDEIG